MQARGKYRRNENEGKRAFLNRQTRITIKAYAFNDNEDIKAMVDSSSSAFPAGLTEEKFFGKPILTKEDLTSAVSGS